MILYLLRCCPCTRATYECALFVPHRCEHCVQITSPVCGWPVGERQMPQTVETQPTMVDMIASLQDAANLKQQTIAVQVDGKMMTFVPTIEPTQKPKATKPKAKATPTKKPKRKSKKSNDFIDFRRRGHVWKACKPKNLIGMSLNEAIGFGIANHDGTLTPYGKKVGKRKKPQRSWNL